jgi:hypothetical protein
MQVGNEKEHQKGQGKRQEKIIPDSDRQLNIPGF